MKELAIRPQAFGSLVLKHQSSVYAYIFDKVRDAASAEELTQQTFVNAFRAFASVRQKDSIDHWLLSIAQNCCRMWFRARQRTVSFADDELLAPEPIDRTSRLQELNRAIGALPAEARQILEMRYQHGLRCAEIASRLRKPIGTIMSQFSRAYEKLRDILGEDV